MRRRRSKSPPIPNGPLDSEMEPTDQGENFLGLMSASFTCSFCLQDTYTFLLPFILYWRVQLDCSCSV